MINFIYPYNICTLMVLKEIDDPDETAKVADALSHSVRVEILMILYEDPNHIMSVKYLLEVLKSEGYNITYAAFLPHQKKLLESGLCSLIKGEKLNMLVLNKYPTIMVEDFTKKFNHRNPKRLIETAKKIEKWERKEWDALMKELKKG